jgi:hypothetical protein
VNASFTKAASGTAAWPNFHLRTDLADFHVYFAAPDHAARWRERIEDFARRPAWLWSPHGDERQRGDEPLVLSEFGSWGLPRPERLLDATGLPPWWFETGRSYFQPSGMAERFQTMGLDRVWPSLGDMADATQWHEFEALQYEIGELRRHDTIQGYVVTELCDANWEANGLLDERRGPKVFHDRLAEVNAPDVVVADLERRDYRGGDGVSAAVTLSSYGEPARGGTLTWWLATDGSAGERASSRIEQWPTGGARVVGRIEVATPPVRTACDAVLHVLATDDLGRERARAAYRLAVVPEPGADGEPLAVAVHDPSALWQVDERVAAIGHRVVPSEDASVVVATELDRDLLDRIERGGRALLLVRSRTAIPPGLELARPLKVHPRQVAHADWPDDRSPWDGDWVTTWSWIRHDILPGLPERAPLDFAYSQVIPDHVLTGYDPRRDGDDVSAGMFAGWVHAPAALAWTFAQGAGFLTVTTFRVAPEAGPVAALLLDRLVRHAAEARTSGLLESPSLQGTRT